MAGWLLTIHTCPVLGVDGSCGAGVNFPDLWALKRSGIIGVLSPSIQDSLFERWTLKMAQIHLKKSSHALTSAARLDIIPQSKRSLVDS